MRPGHPDATGAGEGVERRQAAQERQAHGLGPRNTGIYLKSCDDVDVNRVFILAICQGSSEALRAAAELGDEVCGLATIAGHYRDRDGGIECLIEAGYAARKARGEAVKAKFDASGTWTTSRPLPPV